MTDLESYLEWYAPEALREVKRPRRATQLPELTVIDKALIYYYTDDGFESLNASLHNTGGQYMDMIGSGLVAALAKLPPYEGQAFSGAFLNQMQLEHYQDCVLSGQSVRWPAFLSASEKQTVAREYRITRKKNCLFVIQSRTGRKIEAVSKFGIFGQNEYEILFVPNTEFAVLDVVDETDCFRVVLDEL